MGDSDTRGTDASPREKDLLSHVLSAGSDAVSINVLGDGRFLLANRSLTELTGYSSDELVGRLPEEVGVWKREVTSNVEGRLLTDGFAEFDLEMRTKAGKVIASRASAQAVRSLGQLCAAMVVRPIHPEAPVPDQERSGAILGAATFAALAFLRSDTWRDCIDEVLQRLAVAAGAQRAYLFENHRDDSERLLMSIRAEWTGPGVRRETDLPINTNYPYADGFQRWERELGAGRVIRAAMDELPTEEAEILALGPAGSTVVVPVFAGGNWWGFVGFDDIRDRRVWSQTEVDALLVTAEALGASIDRREVEERLIESEATQRHLIESLPGVVYLAALEGGDTYVSPQYEAMFGVAAEARMSNPDSWTEDIHPEDRDRVVAEDRLSNETLEPFRSEYRALRADGRVVWVRDEAVLVRDDSGNPIRWLGLMTDISDTKEAEQRLQLAEERLRMLVEQIPVATYTEVPEDREAYYISPRIEAITGYPPEAFKAIGFWESKLHPDDRERVLEEERRTDGSDEPFRMDYRYIAADGRTVWLREDSHKVERPGMAPLSQGVIADVTEAKSAEEQLRQAEAKYHAVVDNVPAITYQEVVSGEGYPYSSFIFVSPQFETILGYEPIQDMSDPSFYWERVIHPDDRDAVWLESQRTAGTREPYQQEYRVITADGRVLWLHDESVLVRIEEDGSQLWQGMQIDITERKSAESELRRSESVLQSVAAAGERFLQSSRWELVMDEVLALLGESAGVSRAYLFQVDEDESGMVGREAFEWCSSGIEPTKDRTDNQDFRFIPHEEEWAATLMAGGVVQWATKDLSGEDRAYFEEEGVLSMMAVPVFLNTRMWGYLGFDDCSVERDWTSGELGALRSAASILGAAIERRMVEGKLEEAEASHRALIEHMPAVIYRSDLTEARRKTYISPQYERFFGYTPEEGMADPGLWLRMCHPDDVAAMVEGLKQSERSGEPYELEHRVFGRDGRLLWVHDESVLIRDKDGEPQYRLGMIIDVTERKHAEEELRRHDAILEAVGFAAAQFLHSESWEECIGDVLERLGVAGDVSRSYIFKNLLGVDERLRASLTHEWVAEGIASQLTNAHLQNLVVSAPMSGTGEQPGWARRLAAGEEYLAVRAEFDERERALLGSQGILSILEAPIFVGGEWWGFLVFDDCRTERRWSPAEVDSLRAAAGVLGAVIERQETETKLVKAEERHRLLIEQLPAVVYVDAIDHSSTALYISPQVEDMLGYSPEERVSTPMLWVDSIHPDDRDMVLKESDRTNETGEPFAMDYRMVARDGRTVWVRDEAKVVRDEEGAALHWQGVMFDITERKAAEEELERALTLERDATERLRSLDDMKNTFLTAVSHDLRTPLAAVLGLALTLERDDIGLEESEVRDLAHRIASNARKLERLVTDLLDLDRLSRGIMEPNLSRTDLGLLVRKVVEELDVPGEHPITVEAESVEISVDTAKVERIVENLVANSVRHTPTETRIWVRVYPEADGAILAVEDEGPGVTPELREAVFEPFRQGIVAAPSPGVGIGLSLVARFAELHGGRAWVADREGGGASFRVFFPGRS